MQKGKLFKSGQPIRFMQADQWYNGIFEYYSLADQEAALIRPKYGSQIRIKLKDIASRTGPILGRDNPNAAFKAMRTKRPIHSEVVTIHSEVVKRVQKRSTGVKVKITAEAVKALRTKTNASLSECIEALEYSNGYVKAAATYVRDNYNGQRREV